LDSSIAFDENPLNDATFPNMGAPFDVNTVNNATPGG
jgi:hypothetical protein